MRALLTLLLLVSLPVALVFDSDRAAGTAFVCFFALLLERLLLWPLGDRR